MGAKMTAIWRKLYPIYNQIEDRKLPWVRIWIMIQWRCKHEKYCLRGKIRNLISPMEIQYLWYRDKAYLMRKPSIDRENSKGHYILNNCRFVEIGLNVSLSNLERWKNPIYREKMSRMSKERVRK